MHVAVVLVVVAVRDRLGHLGRDVLEQRAAERDVDQLAAAADADHRLARGDERVEQLDLVAVAHAVAGPLGRERLFAVGLGRDIGAALQHQAVEQFAHRRSASCRCAGSGPRFRSPGSSRRARPSTAPSARPIARGSAASSCTRRPDRSPGRRVVDAGRDADQQGCGHLSCSTALLRASRNAWARHHGEIARDFRARSGRRGAVLRSCPPTPACGRRLLLYFAAHSTLPSRSGDAMAFDGREELARADLSRPKWTERPPWGRE